MDGERSALPERHVVQVQREDLILRQPPLERDRHEPFGELALQRLFGCQERVLDELLRDGAAAAQVFLPADDVVDRRADDADGVDAGMLVETAVFDREDGLHHHGWNHRQRHVAPLFARFGDERGDERRTERQPVHAAFRRDDLDVIDRRRLRTLRAPRREHDADELTLAVAVARDHHHGVASHGELAGLLRFGAVRVAEVVEPIDHLQGRQRLSAPQVVRARVNTGIRALRFSREPRVDHPREADVEINGDDREDRERHAGADEDVELPAATLRAPPRAAHARFPSPANGDGDLGSKAGCKAIIGFQF